MSITYHVCKYTPTELLTALGGQCALLDEAPENFDLSDQVAHPNLCGFGKSVIRKTGSDGKLIDSNNSTNDFESNTKASLIK